MVGEESRGGARGFAEGELTSLVVMCISVGCLVGVVVTVLVVLLVLKRKPQRGRKAVKGQARVQLKRSVQDATGGFIRNAYAVSRRACELKALTPGGC